MKNGIHINNLGELPIIRNETNEMRRKVSCIIVDCHEAITQFSSAIYLDAFITILVLSGKGTVTVNYKSYPLRTDTLLLLSSAHLFHFCNCTSDFKCLCLFVSREFVDEMDSTDMIYKRVKYGVRLYNTPVILLDRMNAMSLSKRIFAIDHEMTRVDHFYYKDIILNSLFAFYLDLSDIIERDTVVHSRGDLTRYESVINSFIELLAVHYRSEHKVDFYASKLNLSAHYLTQIVKRITGQTVSDFIFEMLYSEARNLLTHSKLSVQEIAAVLNFSDQSSFGKFFKRKAGVSPADFRREY